MADVFAAVSKYAMPSSGKPEMTQPQIQSVISAAEQVCGVASGDISRARPLTCQASLARRIAVFVIRQETNWPAKRIAPWFGIESSSVDSILGQARKRLRVRHADHSTEFEAQVRQVRRQAGFE